MEGRIVQKQKTKKLFTLFAVGTALAFGMSWYVAQEDFLRNQKLAYISDLYVPIVFRELSQLSSFLTASSASRAQDDNEDSRGNNISAGMPVLIYHGIVTSPQEGNVSLKNFREQMFALKEGGWETITLNEFHAFMKEEQGLPEKSFLLTFDDGRKDSFYPVDPILRALDYEAVMFVITNQSLGKKGQATHFYLSEEELRRVQNTGRWDIQSHGKFAHEMYPTGPDGQKGHFYSSFLWMPSKQRIETPQEFQMRVNEDLEISKRELEEFLNMPIFAFAFPFGDFGQNILFDPNFKMIEEDLLSGLRKNYSYGFYQWWEGEGFTQNYPDSKVSLVKRIEPENDWSGEELIKMLGLGQAKSLPLSDAFSENKGWISTWGSFALERLGGLVFHANTGEAGASAILDGTGAWRDYELTAQVESSAQTGIFVWVRLKDVNNNAACNFGKDFVHIEQVVNGEKRVIQGVRDVYPIFAGEFTVGVRVQGRNVECLVGSETIVRTQFLDPVLDRGGIGFKMWDEEVGKAALTIKQLVVQKL